MSHYHHHYHTATSRRDTSTSALLQQVAMLANSVMRLSHKMQYNHGHLLHDEQAQLHHHMHLLDGVYLQLQVTATSAVDVVAPDTYQRSEPLHQQEEDEQDCHNRGPATTLAHDSADDGRPCSPAGSVGGRRRTKRQFTTKRCHRCDTSFTSQWRTGPSGPSTLCNACGIRYARHARQAFLLEREHARHSLAQPQPTPPSADRRESPPLVAALVVATLPPTTTKTASRNSISFLLN